MNEDSLLEKQEELSQEDIEQLSLYFEEEEEKDITPCCEYTHSASPPLVEVVVVEPLMQFWLWLSFIFKPLDTIRVAASPDSNK